MLKVTFPLSKAFTHRLTIIITIVGFITSLYLKPYNIWLSVLVAHFIADFIIHSEYVATNKSKINTELTIHVTMYTLFIIALFGPIYGLLNGMLHLVTDYFTSKLNSKLYENEEFHWFFTSTGFDQLIHASCLFLTTGLILH